MLTFTPLETIMISSFTAAVSGISVKLLVARNMVTKDDCSANHEHETAANREYLSKLDELKSDVRRYQADNKARFNTLFRMVRGLIVHSALDKDTQERILNENGFK